MMLRRLLCTFVIAAALGSVVPLAASADSLLGTSSFPTHVSSYGGVTAWSETTSGKYVLALREKGKITHPKVKEREGGPFDVTLGPAEDGHTVALYSRCHNADGSGCDAYKYDLRSKKETRVEQISLTTRDEAWPAQWRNNYAFVRLNYGTGSNDVSDRCDKAYTRPTPRELHIKTVELTHGICGVVTGQVFRKTTIVQTVMDFNTASGNTAMIRTQAISGGSPKVLAKKTSTQPSDVYSSPVMDDKYIYATRTGTGPAPSFVRISRDKNKLTEVEAQTVLAGPVAFEKGSMTYVEVQAGSRGATCGPVTPCRIVSASASPFSSSGRDLLARMTLSAPGEGLFGNQPLAVSGSISVPTVKSGKLVGSHPLSGVPVEIWRAAYSSTPTGQTFVPTQAPTSTSGGDGSWGFMVPPPVPVFGYYTAIGTGAAAAAAQAPIVTLHTSAAITLDAAPRAVNSGGLVKFSGTVAPYQPSRTVNILRPLGDVATENIAQAPVQPDGTFSVSVPVSTAGSYVAELPGNAFDGADGNNTYTGKSPGLPITLVP